MKKREPKLQELKRYVKWLGGGSGPDFEELTDAGILRVTRMMNQDKKRGWWKDRNTKPDKHRRYLWGSPELNAWLGRRSGVPAPTSRKRG